MGSTGRLSLLKVRGAVTVHVVSPWALTPYLTADNLDEYWELLGDVKGPHKKKMLSKLAQLKEVQEQGTATERRHSGAGIDETKDAPGSESASRLEVFASMRFNAAGPAPQARELKAALAERGVLLHIIDVSAGQNITGKLMGKGRARVVFGGRLVRRNRGGRSGGSDFEVAHN